MVIDRSRAAHRCREHIVVICVQVIELQRAVAGAESHGGRMDQRADTRRCLAHSHAVVHDAGNSVCHGQTSGADPAAIIDRQRAVAGVTLIEAGRVDPLRSGRQASDCRRPLSLARAIGAKYGRAEIMLTQHRALVASSTQARLPIAHVMSAATCSTPPRTNGAAL